MSEKYLGVIDSIAPHPCAHVLCQRDLRREIGIIRINGRTGKKKLVFAALIDGATAEAYGYLKNDFLHVDVVKVNREVFQRAAMEQPDVQELLRLADGDADTWRMYADGLTMGLNQVEKPKTREKVMQYRPKNITELSAFVAAVRPGFKSMLQIFLERKHFDYGIPVFDNLIQTREMQSSFLIYQEQVMKTLQYAGFTAPESYAAIKAIAKKHPEKVLPLKERFIKGFSSRILEDDKHCCAEQAKEMTAKVWQIMEDATNYSFNASHAVCVALDSLHGAYAKAHYPLEYYTTLLSNYASKGDKDRIALVKEEMRIGFGIKVVPCKFRQDNRSYFIDHTANTISDALTSVKHISMRVAEALHRMREHVYDSFVDLLHEMEMAPAFDATSMEILIRMGYFEEFGSTGKLLRILKLFKEGPDRFSKAHVPKTQQTRLAKIKELAAALPEEDIPFHEHAKFELAHYGTLLTYSPACKGQYAVLDVDEKYSPKIRMQNIATGTVGVMKVKKQDYACQPVKSGDIIKLIEWEKRPAYQFVDGKPVKKQGIFDLWILWYKVLQ